MPRHDIQPDLVKGRSAYIRAVVISGVLGDKTLTACINSGICIAPSDYCSVLTAPPTARPKINIILAKFLRIPDVFPAYSIQEPQQAIYCVCINFGIKSITSRNKPAKMEPPQNLWFKTFPLRRTKQKQTDEDFTAFEKNNMLKSSDLRRGDLYHFPPTPRKQVNPP